MGKGKKHEETGKEKKVSPKKIETVKKLVSSIKNNPTIILASIKNLPSKQFQNIRKILRGKSDVLVVKKRIMLKAIEDSGNKNIEKLKEYVCEDSAVLFSKEDAFELASILADNKRPISGKAGQITPEDIEAQEGPTDIPPGPAISEFGNLGIQIAVEDGKIAIKKTKVLVKAGQAISEEAASIMAKLEIVPFKIGLEPIAICETNTGKIYLNVKINKEETIVQLKTSTGKALGFAQKIVYCCKETIGYLLAKANANASALQKLSAAPVAEPAVNPEDNAQKETKSEDN
jgi:large subunit ribosomal protein L10